MKKKKSYKFKGTNLPPEPFRSFLSFERYGSLAGNKVVLDLLPCSRKEAVLTENINWLLKCWDQRHKVVGPSFEVDRRGRIAYLAVPHNWVKPYGMGKEA